jgi:hypothetical protein
MVHIIWYFGSFVKRKRAHIVCAPKKTPGDAVAPPGVLLGVRFLN